MTNYASEIKSRVAMQELCEQYGLEFNRTGAARCPFHNEKTPSFRIKKSDNTFHCFGCGVGGSVIDFVMKSDNCNFDTACRKLDAMFNLGLYKHHSFKEHRQMEREARARKKATDEHRRREEYSNKQLDILCNYNRWLMKQDKTKPVKFDLDYLDRIFEQGELITWDATVRINALLEKHSNRGEYDKYTRNRGLDG